MSGVSLNTSSAPCLSLQPSISKGSALIVSAPRAGRNILFAYLGIAVPAAVALILVPYLVQNLGKTRFGLLSLLLSVAAFFTAFDFGTGTALARYTSRRLARRASRERIRGLVEVALLVQVVLGVSVAMTLVALRRLFGYGTVAGIDIGVREFDVAVVFVAASIPFSLASGTARCALEGLGRFGLANALRGPASASTFIAPIVVSFFTARLDLMMFGLLLARVVMTLLFGLALRSDLGIARIPLTRRYTAWSTRVLLSYGGWVSIGVAAGALISLGILDRLLIGKLVGPASIIEYSLPSDVVIRCLLAPAAITSVLIPLLAQTVAVSGPLAETYKRSSILLMGQIGPLTTLLLLNAERLLNLLARGHVDTSSVAILQAMALGLFMHSVAHVPYAALHALGRPNYASVRHLLELPVYAAMSYVLLRIGALPFMGALWAVWAICDLWLITYLLRAASGSLSVNLTLWSPTLIVWCTVLVVVGVLVRLKMPGSVVNALSICAAAFWFLKVSTLIMDQPGSVSAE